MKFIVNHKVIGYETVEIDSDKLKGASKELDVTIVLDESTNDKLYEYYNTVLEMAVNQSKVKLIILAKQSKIRKAIATLLVSYRNYNVYYVPDIDVVDADYLKELESREPTYEEVQTYLGGDVTGHVDIDTIILGITSIISTGELDGLKTFVNNHINSIEAFPEVINQMKKVVDSANSADLIDRIEELKKTLDEQKVKAEESGAELKGAKEENTKLKEDLTYTQNELNKAKTQMGDLKEQASSKGSAVIKTYPVMNTSMINCKVMNILYFKEISYVQYTNSLVNAIIEALRAKKVKFKLLIYDDQNGISSIYKPAPIIGSTEYLKNKATFLRSTEKLVVVEPNPMIIEDILTYTSPAFDVVIV